MPRGCSKLLRAASPLIAASGPPKWEQAGQGYFVRGFLRPRKEIIKAWTTPLSVPQFPLPCTIGIIIPLFSYALSVLSLLGYCKGQERPVYLYNISHNDVTISFGPFGCYWNDSPWACRTTWLCLGVSEPAVFASKQHKNMIHHL